MNYNTQDVINFYKQSKSAYKTAQQYGIHDRTVYNILKRNNVQRIGGIYDHELNSKLNGDLILKEYTKFTSAAKLAKAHGISLERLRKFLVKNNITFFNRGACKYVGDVSEAFKMYNKGASLNSIETHLNAPRGTFKKILKQYNLPLTDRTLRRGSGDYFLIKTNLNAILNLYSQNQNMHATADAFGINPGNLNTYLIKNKLSKGKAKNRNYFKDRQHKDTIYQLYIQEKWCITDIAKHLNMGPWLVKVNLIEKGGKGIIRDKAEESRKRMSTYEEQHKRLSAMSKRKQYSLPSNKIVPLQGYEPHFMDYVFKYSTLSEDDFQWDTRLRIPLSRAKQRSYSNYYPDFYLPKYNLVIEIKSTYTFNMNVYLNKRKIKKTKEHGYKFLMIKDKKYSKFYKFLKENNLLKPHKTA